MKLVLGMLWLIVVVVMPSIASAAVCTRGVNCYCDCVNGIGNAAQCAAKFTVGVPVDSARLLCEDFEAPTLHDNVNVGGGPPNYGPWYDDAGIPGNRGNNSYWFKRYSNGVNSVLWPQGEPVSPTLGTPCTAFSLCTGLAVWHPQNLWSANSRALPFKTPAVVLKNGEFNAEIGSLTSPTGAAGGGSGVFDGAQSWGHRIAAGVNQDAGILGRASWGGVFRTFGMTMALAYPINVASANISDAWKHNEWESQIAGGGGDGLFGFGHSGVGALGSEFPFYGFMGADTGGGITPQQEAAFQARCEQMRLAATIVTGSFHLQRESLLLAAWELQPLS
jgi:hypothetical protein